MILNPYDKQLSHPWFTIHLSPKTFKTLNNPVPPVSQGRIANIFQNIDLDLLCQIPKLWEFYVNPFIPHFTRYVCIIRLCGPCTFYWRRDILINSFRSLYFCLHVFGLLSFIYYLRIASVQPAHQLFFCMCQVAYNNLVWAFHPFLPAKLLSIKKQYVHWCWYHKW